MPVEEKNAMAHVGKTSENIEIRCYELLGVRSFRKLLFLIEAKKHRRDGKKNPNYHLRDFSVYSMECYKGYILYNTCLHVIGIALAASAYLSMLLSGKRPPVLSALVLLILIVNCYSLMLQRYVFLKIRSCLTKRKAVLAHREDLYCQKIEAKLPQYDRAVLLSDYRQFCSIKESMDTGSEIFLDDHAADVLSRVSGIIREPNKKAGRRIGVSDWKKPVGQVIASFPRKPAAVSATTRRVSMLQNACKTKRSCNVLFGYSLITASDSCEAAYRSLFPNGTREEIETIVNAAVRAYEHVLDPGKGELQADGHP